MAEQTQQRIKDIVPHGLPTSDTRLALANAIYFKAGWENEFWEAGTETAVFHSPGGDVDVDMMKLETHMGYGEDDAVQIAELDYKGGAASMVFVLPKQGSLEDLEAGLSADRIQSWLASLSPTKVDMRLPRFTFTTPLDLTGILPELGVPSAFDPIAADFTDMANVPGEPLYLGVVLHKAFVAVDEKGTEAAAATVAMMRAGGMPPPEMPIPFVADRPFLFLIRHKRAGCVLFLGRLADPAMS